MKTTALPFAVLALLSSACGPRIIVRYDVPAAVHFGGAVQHVYIVPVIGDPDVVTVLDPLAELMRTTLVTDVAHHLEQRLAQDNVFLAVSTNCAEPCAGADARIEVELAGSNVNRGTVAAQGNSGTDTRASASVKVRVRNLDGSSRYEATYQGGYNAGVPKVNVEPPSDADLVRRAAFDAVNDFVRDLKPSVGSVSFDLEDEGALEPGCDLAIDGDLDGAWAYFRDLVAKEPNNAAALYDLAVVMTAKGELEMARDAFAAAARLDPRFRDDAEAAERRVRTRDAIRAQQQHRQ